MHFQDERTKAVSKHLFSLFCFASIFIQIAFCLFEYGFDDNIVHPHQPDLFKYFLLSTIPNGQHGNYRRHTEYYSKCGKGRTHFVGQQSIGGYAEITE